jgi:ABC-type transport system involved in cytochrome bd biosynthesis fused ATPase/permease subunit
MVQMIKNLWNKWESLKTWQQVLLLLPFILLTTLFIFYILSPIKSKKLEKEILKHNKKVVDNHITDKLEDAKQLEVEQKKIKAERIKKQEKIEEREKDAEQIIKEINNAGDDVNRLLELHDKLRTRRNS